MNLFVITGLIVLIWALLSVGLISTGVYVAEKVLDNFQLTRREINGITLAFFLVLSSISALLYHGLVTLTLW